MKYQNYKHFKLPITINPLEYGNLMKNIEELNIFIVSITPKTIAIITQNKDFNEISFFRDGIHIFDYTDHKINENSFIRSIENTRFTYKNNQLIQIDSQKSIMLFLINNIKLFLTYLIEDTYNNYKAELFILMELFLVFSIYILFFVIFPEESSHTAMA